MFFLGAFFELATCVHYQEGPIPFLAIDRFATRRGLSNEAMRLLSDVVRALERAAAKWREANAPKK